NRIPSCSCRRMISADEIPLCLQITASSFSGPVPSQSQSVPVSPSRREFAANGRTCSEPGSQHCFTSYLESVAMVTTSGRLHLLDISDQNRV
ncbi:hypothetical protein GOODEAATRI_027920, partial [Goodea atripinnis]